MGLFGRVQPMIPDRSVKLAELVFAWVELREHIYGTVPRTKINVYTTVAIVDRRIDALIASHEGSVLDKTLQTSVRSKT